jgi:hypothetical protein
MTTYEQMCLVVAAAVAWWPQEARTELADWLSESDDEYIVGLANVARHFQPVGPLLTKLQRYDA